MSRLTRRDEYGDVLPQFGCTLADAVEKLAYYEDLEEQGRLTVQAHGQWYPMHFGGVWQCSECRYLTKDNKATSYCPNCGAKMEA